MAFLSLSLSFHAVINKSADGRSSIANSLCDFRYFACLLPQRKGCGSTCSLLHPISYKRLNKKNYFFVSILICHRLYRTRHLWHSAFLWLSPRTPPSLTFVRVPEPGPCQRLHLLDPDPGAGEAFQARKYQQCTGGNECTRNENIFHNDISMSHFFRLAGNRRQAQHVICIFCSLLSFSPPLESLVEISGDASGNWSASELLFTQSKQSYGCRARITSEIRDRYCISLFVIQGI